MLTHASLYSGQAFSRAGRDSRYRPSCTSSSPSFRHAVWSTMTASGQSAESSASVGGAGRVGVEQAAQTSTNRPIGARVTASACARTA